MRKKGEARSDGAEGRDPRTTKLDGNYGTQDKDTIRGAIRPSPPSPPNPPPPSMIPLLSTSSHTVHSPRCTAWVKQADQRGSHMHCCLPYHDGGQAVAAAGRAISARLSGRDDPARGRSCVRLIRVFILS